MLLYGRQREVNYVMRQIMKNDVIEVIGLRGVGKTAFLKLISRKLERTDRLFSLFFECEYGMDISEIVLEKVRALFHVFGDKEEIDSIANSGFTELFGKLRKKIGKTIVFIIDDAYKCNKRDLETFLKTVVNAGAKCLLGTIKGLFKYKKVILSRLDKKSFSNLVKGQLPSLNEDVLNRLYAVTGGIPSYTHFLLVRIREWVQKNKMMPNSTIVDKIMEKEISDGVLRSIVKDYVASYYKHYKSEFVKLLTAMKAQIRGLDTNNKLFVKKFQEIGLVILDKNRLKIIDPLVREYLSGLLSNQVESVTSIKFLSFPSFEKKPVRLSKKVANLAIVGNNLRLYDQNIYIEITPSPSVNLLKKMVKIRDILGAKEAYMICSDKQVVGVSGIEDDGIKIIQIHVDNKNNFFDKGLEIAQKIIREHSKSQQNL